MAFAHTDHAGTGLVNGVEPCDAFDGVERVAILNQHFNQQYDQQFNHVRIPVRIIPARKSPLKSKKQRHVIEVNEPVTSNGLIRRPGDDDRKTTRSTGLNRIKNIELEMNQLRLRFAEDYYPSNLDRGRRPFEFLTIDLKFNLPIRAFYASRISLMHGRYLAPKDLALSLSVDAISLAGMASSTNNKSALFNAFKIYHAALTAYRQAVFESVNLNQDYDSKLLVTAQALHFCQQFCGLGEVQGDSVIHIRGLGNMIASRGLENMTTEDDRVLLQDYQQYALRYGLMLRKPVNKDLEEAWFHYDMRFEGPFSQLNHLAIRIPTMLEEADAVCQTLANLRPRFYYPEIASRATAIIQQLQDEESALQAFYDRTYPADRPSPYHPIDISEIELLRDEMPVSQQDTFPCAFKFSSFHPAVCHSRFWACLLEIRSTIANVLNAMTFGDDWSSMDPGIRQHNVTECADELCQTMMFYLGNGNGFAGFMPVTGNLKSVHDWYKRIGDKKKVVWCRHIAKIIRARGICPPVLR